MAGFSVERIVFLSLVLDLFGASLADMPRELDHRPILMP